MGKKLTEEEKKIVRTIYGLVKDSPKLFELFFGDDEEFKKNIDSTAPNGTLIDIKDLTLEKAVALGTVFPGTALAWLNDEKLYCFEVGTIVFAKNDVGRESIVFNGKFPLNPGLHYNEEFFIETVPKELTKKYGDPIYVGD